MKETWKSVVGFEGRYEVSDHGRVRSLDRACLIFRNDKRFIGSYLTLRKGRVLRPGLASNGYPTVVLGRGNTRTVHSLVAEAFIGACPRGQEVLHRNGERQDPRAKNLRYGTRSDNNNQIVTDGGRKLTANQIRLIRDELRFGPRGTGAALSREFGVSESQISNIRHRRQYAHV